MAESVRRVHLASGSLAEDAGYHAAADIALLCAERGIEYRLVGGLAVALIHATHGAPGEVPPRQTADADLGAEGHIVAESGLDVGLLEQGYRRIEGNRFVKGGGDLARVIDVLVPTMGDRIATNVPCGPLTVDAVPGLRLALSTEPLPLSLSVLLSTGETVETRVDLPQVIPAIVLKAYAFAARSSERDLLDLWKLLEVTRSAGTTVMDWQPVHAQKRDAIRHLYQRVVPATSVGASIARGRGLAGSEDRGLGASARANARVSCTVCSSGPLSWSRNRPPRRVASDRRPH